MKTFDAEELLSRHLRLGAYPADSLTRREIIATVSGDIEEMNTKITAAIYKYVTVSKFKSDPKLACDELTAAVIAATDHLTVDTVALE